MEKDVPEEIRKLLKIWDDGHISRGGFESQIHDLFFNPLEWIEKGEDIMSFGSCCSSHPPDRTFKVEVTIQPHGYTVKRCD